MKATFLALYALCLASLIQTATADETLPNILFIYLDDLGYGDTSCYNPQSKINTPNIDQLAAEGVMFTDAHTPAPICGPSRYGLMTGRYPWRRGKGGTGNGAKFRDTFIEKGRSTIASLLKKKDYNTAQIGKWGIRHHYSEAVKSGKKPGSRDSYDFPNKKLLGPQLFGFDYSWCMVHLFGKNGRKVTPYDKHQLENGLPIDPELKLSDPYRWLPESATKVVEYLETYAGKKEAPQFKIDPEKPFFIYWDPPSPHEPIVPNKEFLGKSNAGKYGDFVVEIDHYVGEVLQTLERLKLSNNTLVIFSSDNGAEGTCYQRIKDHGHYSMGLLRGAKRDMWEAGHRVPMIVRWPGKIKAAQRCDALVSITDWYATICDITDQKLLPDEGEDSISIRPLLNDPKFPNPPRESVIHHSSTRFAIRHDQWLLIKRGTGNANNEPAWFRKERKVVAHHAPGELFQLDVDPQETTNLYKKYPEKVKILEKQLEEIMQGGGSR